METRLDINDTIAGIATPHGVGGIGIIRVSGPDAGLVATALFTPKGAKPKPKLKDEGGGGGGSEFIPRHFYYGELRSVDRGDSRVILDDVNLVYMPGPNSYTGEDVVEFHCHGGSLILRNVVSAVIAQGARMAEPGEFTRQAFMNGKLDLAQAEAVLDLIRAGTEPALFSARGRLEGRLSSRLKAERESLFTLVSRIEAELDFSEDEVDKLPAEELLAAVYDVEASLKGLVSTYDEGSALRDGVKVAILGRPNVGKSSLLNLILKEERAIVTSEAGTTRDVIEEVVNLRGLPVRLMDTAGLRSAKGKAETIGVKRAKERATEARLVLFVVDSSSEASFNKDIKLLDAIEQKVIVVANKSDLIKKKAREDLLKAFGGRQNKDGHEKGPVFISALTEDGLADLEDAIFKAVTGHAPILNSDSIDGKEALLYEALGETITSARHKAALELTLKGLKRAINAEGENMPMEIIASELRGALDRIGEITGETTTEDILDRIFSEFCIGK